MKTTVDIPDDMLDELIENTEARTKREAILTAIEEYKSQEEDCGVGGRGRDIRSVHDRGRSRAIERFGLSILIDTSAWIETLPIIHFDRHFDFFFRHRTESRPVPAWDDGPTIGTLP